MKSKEFEKLIGKWRDQGTITPEQATYMVSDLQESASEESGKKFIHAVGILGGLALSAGVLLVIASNWEYLGKGIKLVLALLMSIIPLALAYYIVVIKESETIWGRVLNLFGLFLIGGSLAMIGQIYNLESEYTRFLWTWTLLAAPFIFVFRKVENVSFVAVAVGVAGFAWITDAFDSYYNTQQLFLTMTVAALSYAAIIYILGNAFRSSTVWEESARALRLMSASAATITLFFMTFEFYAREITDSSYDEFGWVPLSIMFNLLFIAFMVFVLMQAFKHQEERVAMSAIRLLGFYLIVKYFTLFSDMLDTGTLMVFGGLLFIGGAWYLEKNKKVLMGMMRNGTPTPPPTVESGAFTSQAKQDNE